MLGEARKLGTALALCQVYLDEAGTGVKSGDWAGVVAQIQDFVRAGTRAGEYAWLILSEVAPELAAELDAGITV